MREFDFIFYRDTEQGNGDWHETLSVINFTRTPPQKQVMLDAYGKARTVNESGFKGRNAASAAAAAAENRLLAENIRRLVCRMTAFATEFALYGNLWQQWITYMIMMHENAFTMACERRTVSSSSTIMKLAERDFGLFRELMNLDLDAFGKETGTDLLGLFANYKMPYAQEGDSKAGKQIRMLCGRLARAADAREFGRIVTEYYTRFGTGMFGLFRAFRIAEGCSPENKPAGAGYPSDHYTGYTGGVNLVPVVDAADVTFNDLVGYEEQKATLKANTEAFLAGRHANNVLLYGDSGTGKSTSIHALMHDYYDKGLRLVEISKPQRRLLPQVLADIKKRNYKFIIYLDDLSFEENESDYKELKAMLEGALETREDSVLIYATSNRRHLIRETWKDRSDMEYNEDVHRSDTMEEKLSLASRFGVTIYYAKPDPKEYMEIVKALAKRKGIKLSGQALEDAARKWELRHGGMSGRTASQFITWLEGRSFRET